MKLTQQVPLCHNDLKHMYKKNSVTMQIWYTLILYKSMCTTVAKQEYLNVI